MNAEQKVMLRENLLRQLASSRPLGLLVSRLAQGARMEGFYLGESELEAELTVLLKKGLVETHADSISIAQTPHWRITSAGLGELDARGY